MVHDTINALQMGYETLEGDMGNSQSDVEKQHVLRARALYKHPKVLLMDEATSALDVGLEQAVNVNVTALEITSIIVVHRPTIRPGSGTSSPQAFLQAAGPRLGVFQVGYRNRYHHPKAEVFERYREMGIGRLRTDEDGAVLLNFGAQVEAKSYRTEHLRYWYGRWSR